MRRRGAQLEVTLVAVVDPGQGEPTRKDLSRAGPVDGVRLSLAAPGEPTLPAGMQEANARAALELEQRVEGHPDAMEASLPRLIRLWEQSDQPLNALRWRAAGLQDCMRRGYYEEAILYGEPILPSLDSLCRGDAKRRWSIVGWLCPCLSITGRAERAARILEDEVVAKTDDPAVLARALLTLSVQHSRYLPKRDLEIAERYAQRAAAALTRIVPPTDEARSVGIEVNNALALIRVHEKKYDEALEICRASLAIVDAFDPQRSRMRRAVALKRIAELFAISGAYDEALVSQSAAIEIDPGFADNYALRGITYFKAGRVEDAEVDFRKAIAMSPPYAEAFVNLGQCYRAMDRADAAALAYSRAVDLEPENTLALVGRAACYEQLGDADKACADYDAVLSLSPNDVLALANRAVVHYESGRLLASADDLNRAVAISPDTADFYQNRAVVLADLGRQAEAIEDLSTYLRLRPDAEDRREVEERLSTLQGARRHAPVCGDCRGLTEGG
jgi:tetratricopeptide (TPR) repeat protein